MHRAKGQASYAITSKSYNQSQTQNQASSENAGLSRAKAGAVRRLSMVALRCTARHVLRGLAIVGSQSTPAHPAQRPGGGAPCPLHDTFGADRGVPKGNPTNG